MIINRLKLKNFKGFEELSVEFHPHFNVVIGINRSGKTSLLEGLRIGLGSFFLGIDEQEVRSPRIRDNDIHFVTYEHSREFQFPVCVECEGIVNGKNIRWIRERRGKKNGTTFKDAWNISAIAIDLQTQIRHGKEPDMPVLAYYATNRLWQESKKSGISETKLGRGYYNGFEATSNNAFFLKWFEEKERTAIQRKKEAFELDVIKKAVSQCVSECETIFFDFDEKVQTIVLRNINGKEFPFNFLSDGERNLLAMVADMAFRCVTLNPHLGKESISMSPGIILIDELDLHLHPLWQKTIISNLKKTFPNIQFITTTHSPFIIQELDDGELIKLDGEISEYTDQSLEDIAENVQGVENSQWSMKRKRMYEAAKEYYQTLEKMDKDTASEELEQLRNKLDELSKPFAKNLAYHAFLEQKRLVRESEIKKI